MLIRRVSASVGAGCDPVPIFEVDHVRQCGMTCRCAGGRDQAAFMLRTGSVIPYVAAPSREHAFFEQPQLQGLFGDTLFQITRLAAMFSKIIDSRCLRLRLDVIETNACRKCHIDAVTARLICTYRGRATQYGNGSLSAEPSDIHDVPTGSPMILRGTSWRSAAPPGLMHRSPQSRAPGRHGWCLFWTPL